MVVPTGIVRVIAVDGRNLTGKIGVQFERIADGQFAIPLSTYSDPGNVRAVQIENGMRGSIIAVRDLHPVPKVQDFVFVDRGRADGIVQGDVFEVLARSVDGDRSPERCVYRERFRVGDVLWCPLESSGSSPWMDAPLRGR